MDDALFWLSNIKQSFFWWDILLVMLSQAAVLVALPGFLLEESVILVGPSALLVVQFLLHVRYVARSLRVAVPACQVMLPHQSG